MINIFYDVNFFHFANFLIRSHIIFLCSTNIKILGQLLSSFSYSSSICLLDSLLCIISTATPTSSSIDNVVHFNMFKMCFHPFSLTVPKILAFISVLCPCSSRSTCKRPRFPFFHVLSAVPLAREFRFLLLEILRLHFLIRQCDVTHTVLQQERG